MGYASANFWVFPITFEFPKFLNFKLFDNSWRKPYRLFFVLDFIYHFTCGESTYPKILIIIYMRDYKLSTGKQFDVTKLLKFFQFFPFEYFCDFNDRLDWRRLTRVNCLKETWNVNSKTQSRWNIKHSSMSRGRQNTIYLRRYTQIEHADNWSKVFKITVHNLFSGRRAVCTFMKVEIKRWTSL